MTKIFFIIAVLFSITAWSQKKAPGVADPKKRTQIISDTELGTQMVFLSESKQGIIEIAKEVEKLYTQADEEYFAFHLRVALKYAVNLGELKNAFHHFDIAASALKTNYPFYYNDTPAFPSKSSATWAIVTHMLTAYRVNKMFASAVKLLESNSDILSELSEDNKRTYFVELASNSAEMGQIEKAIEILTQNKKYFYMNEINSIFYNELLAKFYVKEYKYAESIPYSIKFDSALRNINSQFSKVKGWYKTIRLIGGTNFQLLLALHKTGSKAEAEPYAIGLLDKGINAYLNNDFAACKKIITQCKIKLDAFKNNPMIGNAGEVWYYKEMHPWLIKAEIRAANYQVALNLLHEDISKMEKELEESFHTFTEAQRKEFFSEYTKKLSIIYSFLPMYAEQDSSIMQEMLNKSIQTKGLILDVTREQENMLRKNNNPVTLHQINILKKYRDKYSAFSQQALQIPALADSANRYSSLLTDLQRKVNQQLGVSTIIKKFSWQDIQKVLKPDEAFIEIMRIDRDNFMFDPPVPEYWAFVIKPGVARLVTVLLGKGSDFENRQFKFYQNNILSQLEDQLSYGVFWKKLADIIGEQKRIYLSADGMYQLLNPLTLFNPATKKYLADEVELVRIATGRDMLIRRVEEAKLKNITLIGSPDFTMSRKTNSNQHKQKDIDITEVLSASGGTRAGFTMLPGTKREIEIIALIARANGTLATQLKDIEASEHNVKNLEPTSVLHIATHGEFESRTAVDSYLKSKLVLAGAGDKEDFSILDYEQYEDGFLTAYEVTQLELSTTKLIVLSACETGLGEVQSGEGVWGLQRAFQLAGAQSVMCSLWKISDEATVTFMEAFYKNYLSGLSSLQAYRVAMTVSKTKYPHPYYWGAFILSGSN
jgi:hypothetical protein